MLTITGQRALVVECSVCTRNKASKKGTVNNLCGILGILRNFDTDEALSFSRKLLELNSERGRDGYGCFIYGAQTAPYTEVYRTPGRSALLYDPLDPLLTRSWRTALVNCRAEPMTERLPLPPTQADQQPYLANVVGGTVWAVIHNGIIANDKQLIAEYDLEPPTRIDSWVIAGLLAKGLPFVQVIEKLQGSLAIIAASAAAPRTLFFATNYRPLYHCILRDRTGDILATALSAVPYDEHSQLVHPYTCGTMTADGELHVQDAFREVARPKYPRTLVVCSGGLDSTVVASKLIADGHLVELLHFGYGCRAGDHEHNAVQRLAMHFKVPLHYIDTDIFRRIGHSRLIEGGQIDNGEAGAEQAIEWVPARNTIMASIAMGIAEANKFDHIALGINLEEAGGGYTDNCLDLYAGFNSLMHWIVGVNKRLSFIWPVGNLMKHEIVMEGYLTGAPFHLTWSCYNSGNVHCGNCGPCIMRKRAFEKNGMTDPVFQCDELVEKEGNFVI